MNDNQPTNQSNDEADHDHENDDDKMVSYL